MDVGSRELTAEDRELIEFARAIVDANTDGEDGVHGVRARVGATHLPVGDLLNALTAAGLGIERVVEAGSPVPDILAVRGRRLVTGDLGG